MSNTPLDSPKKGMPSLTEPTEERTTNTETAGVHVQGSPILAAEGLTQVFKNVVALDNVTIDVREGEALFLLGPSGCGKSTLLRVLAGLARPTAGRITLDGENITTASAVSRDIGFVFQSYALFPHMTVYENLEFGLRAKKIGAKERRNRIDQVLDLVQLPHVKDRYPRQLSGGQQQRVAVARTVVTRPRVLLLDEPLSNLDARLREDMQIELRSMQRRLGLTTIFVTHDQAEAQVMAERVAIMKAGRFEQIASPQRAYEYPETQFVAEFLGDANLVKASYVGRKGGGVEYSTPDNRRIIADVSKLESSISPSATQTLMMRPEWINIGLRSSVQEINTVDGTIRDAIFTHGTILYTVVDPSGRVWKSRKLASDTQLAVGQSVTLSWSPNHTVCIRNRTAETNIPE